ncbi:cob(I)yrinic acid a,c-diamide adenosyltransferase [Paraflavisolibacter sp. H34]|uniref:cob(I)yrinic acid a,c-diamide adenosyltransferase n=1 Tax=Huijunlia imazamoxiresistens TaxID=3127457 RepID=UPI0030160BAE
MATKIYTKTGDKGATSLIGGTKVPKSDLRIETYGTVDELNSWIGMVNDQLQSPEFTNELRDIQDRLFTIGAALACDAEKEPKMKLPDLHDTDIRLLETKIDEMTAQLPPMKSFLLPGGHVTVSSLHVCRCVCRRAERLAVNLQQHDLFVEPKVIIYLNRLSDYLFVLARYTAQKLGVEEIPWKPRV